MRQWTLQSDMLFYGESLQLAWVAGSIGTVDAGSSGVATLAARLADRVHTRMCFDFLGCCKALLFPEVLAPIACMSQHIVHDVKLE